MNSCNQRPLQNVRALRDESTIRTNALQMILKFSLRLNGFCDFTSPLAGVRRSGAPGWCQNAGSAPVCSVNGATKNHQYMIYSEIYANDRRRCSYAIVQSVAQSKSHHSHVQVVALLILSGRKLNSRRLFSTDPCQPATLSCAKLIVTSRPSARL